MRRAQIAWAAMVAVAAGVSVASIDLPTTSDIVVSGNLRHRGLYQEGSGDSTTYEVTTLRYVVDAPPANVGFVVGLDPSTVDSLCKDEDGCLVSLQMLDFDQVGEPGAVASATNRFFVAESSSRFRFDDHAEQAFPFGAFIVKGVDDDGSETSRQFYDCLFTDGEESLGENLTDDAELGFGLLNLAGSTPEDAPVGTFSDATTTCRVVVSD